MSRSLVRSPTTAALVLLGVGLLSCGGRESGPGRIAATACPVAGLEARLVVGGEPVAGALRLEAPFARVPDLRLQVTNRSASPFQLPRSSYPSYAFFQLEIVRVGAEGGTTGEVPIVPYPDLYPMKDMGPPGKLWATLAPGLTVERKLHVLLREGYLLDTFAHGAVRDHLTHLLAEGFGALRTPGTYRMRGVYRAEATALGNAPAPSFEGERGRDQAVPAWAGPLVRTSWVDLVVEAP